MTNNLSNTKFFSQIVDLLQSARSNVVRAINQTMVLTYFEIGRIIVEEEQGGKERAAYGKQLLKELSKVLTKEFGRGFSVQNLERMRSFYLAYSISSTALRISKKGQTMSDELQNEKSQTLSAQFHLSWSHYLKLLRIDDENERKFYEIEAVKNNWSVRELERQYDSALYTRLALSRDKEKVKELSKKGLIIEKPKDAIKDPYILEFIGLPAHSSYTENQLEEEIINKLEHFLLELGSGFTFVARQKRISFDDKHFWIDLVFYNRILKSFVLIDLKIGELKHQDIGQMQMYVNYYDREVRLEDENKTIGIILCQNKSEAVVEFTLPENNEHIFASRYKTVLPSKEDLKSLIKEQ
ncbi:PDDEXK nuclease domain-containing protein [Flavobacterium sp. CBA20B-1]|uniref:PDDEXK nuclease domain-containing protein n=1 Tax=unclassified Flavobacterium TaxID=196869 RepID=UPI002224A384|nr:MULTISPECIES: PDDEXK nuclease domain-containing protein [unclassified Flavobacterium]WCM41097.1 PDDEXK nuclease domain-containing protein [Flavobacterium sp. CBA20B-1]